MLIVRVVFRGLTKKKTTTITTTTITTTITTTAIICMCIIIIRPWAHYVCFHESTPLLVVSEITLDIRVATL